VETKARYEITARSIDMQDLSRLGARPHPFEVGIFRRLVFGLALALDAPLLLFLLLLFSRAFSDSFFQVGSSPMALS
jgi:hypothetical protein